MCSEIRHMAVEFENSSPTIKDVPQLELKFLLKSLVAAFKQYKIQQEVNAMSGATKIETEEKKNYRLHAAREIEKILEPLSDDDRECVVSKMGTTIAKINGGVKMSLEKVKLKHNPQSGCSPRKSGIGSSEAAAILGLSPFKTNVEVWEEKVGLREPKDISDNPAVKTANRRKICS